LDYAPNPYAKQALVEEEYRPNQPDDATPWHNYDHFQSYSYTDPRLNVEGYQVNRFPNPP
jgi:hypothetical protein